MFKGAKWRVDKSKTKVDFRLQFQATQVPQTGWDKLYVSLVSLETGKTAGKTGRVSPRNGSCQWPDPIYETTKLEEDSKCGKSEEKLYNIVLATGSSQFGFLGETTINLADYIRATAASSVSLPLQSCTTGTILHVTIQRLTAKTGQRDFDNQMHLLKRGHHIIATELADDDDPDQSPLFSDRTMNGRPSEDSSITTSTSRLSCDYGDLAPRHSEANGNFRVYPPTDTISTSSSGSSYTEKQEPPDVHENVWKGNGIHQDAMSFLSYLRQNSKPRKSVDSNGHLLTHIGQPEMKNSEWTHLENHDHSFDNAKTNIHKENERLKKSLKSSESTIEELQNENFSLDRQAEELVMEMETLKKQLAKEIKQGQEFSREISSLKIERDNLKSEFEQLKSLELDSEKIKVADKPSNEIIDAKRIIEELKQELGYEKEMNINLSLQLQKTQDSNSELLLAVQDLEQLLEQKNKEIEEISNRTSETAISVHNNEARSVQDIEMEWLQQLSSSEQKIREITDKIILNSSKSCLEFVQKEMKILERAFQEAKHGSRNLMCVLNNEIDIRNNRISDLECSMHYSSRKGTPFKNITSSQEAKEKSIRKPSIDSDEDKRMDCNQPLNQTTIPGLQHLQDEILLLDKVRAELKNKNQNLEEEIRINRINITDLESQLSMVDEEAQALAEANQQLEERIENLEAENLELQNCLHASHEAGKLARKQIGDLMEEMSILSVKTESESGIGKNIDRQTFEEDHGDMGNALDHLQKQNEDLLDRIFELETQKNESQLIAKEKDEELRKTERKLASALELEKKVSELCREAQDYKMARDYMATEIEQIEHEYEALKLEHAECALRTPERQTEKELQEPRYDYAASLSMINMLESKVNGLQQELDTQATKFAADLDAMLQLKSEQEQRAKRAEEALRNTRWTNATAAERIQEEFKKLSRQMTATFDANEKLATQALAEASELRLQRANLQEALQKAEEEIVSIREQCKENLKELTSQLDISKKEGEALSSKLRDTLDELEKQKKIEANNINQTENLSLKLSKLQTEVEVLRNEKSGLIKKAEECEYLKADLEDARIALDGCTAEKAELDIALQSVNLEKFKLNEEVRTLQEKLKNSEIEMKELKHSRDDQERRIKSLESMLDEQAAQISANHDSKNQLVQLGNQYSELQQKLSQKELETQDSKKQIIYLQEELQNKEDVLATVERKLRDKEERLKLLAAGGTVRPVSKANSKMGPPSRNGKELSDLKDKVKLLENEVMSKTLALEASRQEFNAKEKNLQIRIEQLETISQHLNQKQTSFSLDQLQDELKTLKSRNSALLQKEKELLYKLRSQENLQKEVKHLRTINEKLESMFSKESSNSGKSAERVLALEKEVADALDENKSYKKQLQSTLTKKEDQELALRSFQDMNQLLKDMETLKEKNFTMEEELKEMHARYSQISLKFAEVEGERQQLVMAIRNLKNAKKA